MKLSVSLANPREVTAQLLRLDQMGWGKRACLVIQPNLQQTAPDHLTGATKG